MNRFRFTILVAGLVGILATSTARAGGKDFAARSATDHSLVRLSQFRGKVVLINFWQSTCGWCKRQTPRLVELNRKYRSKGLVIISVSLQAERSASFRKKLPDYLRQHRMTWPQVMGGVGELEKHFGRRVKGTPSNFVISREGKEVFFGSGTREAGWKKLEDAVATEIAKRLPAGDPIVRPKLQNAPRLGIPNSKGNVVTLKQFAGKPMIVHFFNHGNAHWLGKAMPEFHRTYGPRGVQIVGVCIEKRSDSLAKYMQKYKPGYPILIGNKQTRRDWIGASKTWGLLFINAKGQIVKRYDRSYSGMHKTEYPWFAEHLLAEFESRRKLK